jgi:hypothetical protein
MLGMPSPRATQLNSIVGTTHLMASTLIDDLLQWQRAAVALVQADVWIADQQMAAQGRQSACRKYGPDRPDVRDDCAPRQNIESKPFNGLADHLIIMGS